MNPASTQSAAQADDLDTAVRETSDYLNKQLPRGNKLMILNVQSEFPALSEYIIDELIANTVNDRVFSVVDRQQLNTIRAELEFQTSGEVDDDTAQALGRMAGAQIIISGAISQIGDLYRLRVRALSVQSAQIEGQFNRNIPESPTVAALVRSRAIGYGGESQGGAARSTGPAVPAGMAATSATAPAPASATTVLVQAESAQSGTSAPIPVSAPAAPSVAYNTGGTGPAGGTIFYPVVRTASVPPATTQDYKAGDTGPAGGIIFYVNPNAGEWKYLEAAPASTEVACQWSISQTISTRSIKDSRSVGTGKPNTEYIMQQAMQLGGGFGWAAQACDELVVNGFDDWFLPSRDELNIMWGALHRRGTGGFKSEWYWSSTPSNDNGTRSWIINFADGRQFNHHHQSEYSDNWNQQYRVRAIRQF
jgi:hypothetical protein